MNVLLVTDSFPPTCGGSGWSTYELARGLRDRGHLVLVVQVVAGKGGREQELRYGGVPVIQFHTYAPAVPGLRSYFKNERLYPKLARRLERAIAENLIEIVHGQHVLSAPAAVLAARAAGISSVVTIRDYWPVCYRSDLIHTAESLALCPGCSRAAGLPPSQPSLLHPARLLAQRYLDANMAAKRAAVASADAVIAVSSVIAQDLRDRAAELAGTTIEVIPNPVDITTLRRHGDGPRPLPNPYALYVGKLAVNKGTDHLIEAVDQADLDWPLVIAGDGPDRQQIEAAARRTKRDVRFLGWIDHRDAAVWLAHAAMLIFPSRGPESLSRVLIEASALGRPIAAMRTGGTADVVEDEITGLLSESAEGLAEDIRRIRRDEVLRRRLGAAAANRATEKFDAPRVVARIEARYLALLAGRRR
jgi:glycogen synthase